MLDLVIWHSNTVIRHSNTVTFTDLERLALQRIARERAAASTREEVIAA